MSNKQDAPRAFIFCAQLQANKTTSCPMFMNDTPDLPIRFQIQSMRRTNSLERRAKPPGRQKKSVYMVCGARVRQAQ